MFETLDYRNARYQGEVKNEQPNGIGIIIDYNYLFCLAEWRDGRINGPAFVVFPDSRIFCGRIFNNELSGLCSFYLQDRIQIFANYQQKSGKMNNFIAILPFCKVLLQIDRNGPQPKVCHHQTYNSQQNSLESKLASIFGKRLDLSEFQDWKDFLFLNLIKPYPKKMYWKQNVGIKSQQIFFGLKHSGLGAKIINLFEEKEIMAFDGDCFVVTSMGSYSTQQQLRGLGKQLVQYSMNKMQEQGCYGESKSEIIQYPRKERPLKGQRIFIHELKTSYNFNNTFFDIKICYDLLSKYERINVEIMQQNRKIAQIIIEKKNDNIVLAEIQNKKQRKLTPQKSQRVIQSQYRRVNQPQKMQQSMRMKELTPQQDRMHRYPSQVLSVNPETRKSIYSSAQKRQKYKKNSPKKAGEAIIERYKAPYQYKQSQSFQKQGLQRPKAFNYNESIEKQSRTLSKNRQSKKYLYQTILDNPNSLSASYLQAKEQIKPNYYQKSTYHLSSKYNSKQRSLQKYSPRTIKKRETPHLQNQNQNENSNFGYPDQSRSRQQSPPLLNRYRNSKSPRNPDRSLIQFFNQQIEEQYPSYSPLNKGFIYDAPNNSNWTLGNTPKRQKTPGKIVTFKKKHDHNTYYQ